MRSTSLAARTSRFPRRPARTSPHAPPGPTLLERGARADSFQSALFSPAVRKNASIHRTADPLSSDHVHQRDAGRRQLRGQLQRLLRAVRQVGRNQHMVKARSRCRGRLRFHTHNSSARSREDIPSPLVPLGCGIGPDPTAATVSKTQGVCIGRNGLPRDAGRLSDTPGLPRSPLRTAATAAGSAPLSGRPRHLAELGVDLSAQLLDEWNVLNDRGHEFRPRTPDSHEMDGSNVTGERQRSCPAAAND